MMTPAGKKEKPVVEKHGLVFESAEATEETTGDFELVKDNEMTETKEGDMVVFDTKREEETEEESDNEEESEDEEESQDEDEEAKENEEERGDENEKMEVVELPPTPEEIAQLKKELEHARYENNINFKVVVGLLIILGGLYFASLYFFTSARASSKLTKDLTEQVTELTQKLEEQEKLLKNAKTETPEKELSLSDRCMIGIAMCTFFAAAIAGNFGGSSRSEKLKKQLDEANEKVAQYKAKERKRLAVKYPIFRKPQAV